MSRPRLTYANVMSSIAVFVALGGTSYAVTSLPHNSVGAKQIRRSAVGSSEIKNGAVHLADIAKTTRTGLRGAKGDQGAQGPTGATGAPGAPAVSYFATVSGAGEFLRGNANNGGHYAVGSGSYTIGFARNVSACTYTATLGGIDQTNPAPGFITVRDDGGKVGVQIYDTAGNPVDRSFHLLVAC
jgi:hypothetical protein